MPVPKKRHSNTRTLRRRATWKIKPVNYGSCPECGSEVLSHTACSVCGKYKGRQVIAIKEKKPKKKEN